ncbi:stage II sporulation protein R, partial [Enterobacter quasiroggenkampii]|nr:stage II sporulation protein R [Enterobacter quasiroggenkampii]
MNMKLRVFVLGLAIAVLAAGALMRWENGHAEAIDNQNIQKQTIEKQDHIPEDAIRLRILANSDAENDQRVKRMVRDRIVEQINGWL